MLSRSPGTTREWALLHSVQPHDSQLLLSGVERPVPLIPSGRARGAGRRSLLPRSRARARMHARAVRRTSAAVGTVLA